MKSGTQPPTAARLIRQAAFVAEGGDWVVAGNLDAMQKSELALTLKPLYAARGKERMVEGEGESKEIS